MNDKWVTGVFADSVGTNQALQVLNKSFDARDISVLSSNEDELTDLVVPDHARSDRFIAYCGIIGLVIGLVGGSLTAMPLGATVIVSPLLSGFMGAAAGWCLGIVIGAVMHFDERPAYNRITSGRLKKGRFMVVVHVRTPDDRFRAESIMDEFGVSEVLASNHALAGV